jgi:hypothetical protein
MSVVVAITELRSIVGIKDGDKNSSPQQLLASLEAFQSHGNGQAASTEYAPKKTQTLCY